jgi:CheY-like chemotaxis protein
LESAVARILVVDDDPGIREQIRLHLAFAGYEVATAGDGIEAGYSIIESWPDLILCDIEMPHLDGPGLRVLLASDPSLPAIPIVFLTSEDEARTRERIGGGQFLAKPLAMDRLLEALDSRFLRRRMASDCVAV